MNHIDLQSQSYDWAVECFGIEKVSDIRNRSDRFIEEVFEFLQSLNLLDKDRILQLFDYVDNRPEGNPHQELGGVLMTLSVLSTSSYLVMRQAWEDELNRVRTMTDKIREKDASKPVNSPLPGSYKTIREYPETYLPIVKRTHNQNLYELFFDTESLYFLKFVDGLCITKTVNSNLAFKYFHDDKISYFVKFLYKGREYIGRILSIEPFIYKDAVYDIVSYDDEKESYIAIEKDVKKVLSVTPVTYPKPKKGAKYNSVSVDADVTYCEDEDEDDDDY